MHGALACRAPRLCIRQARLYSSSASSQSQVFHLPDGRQLGYAEYGIPSGKPLLYFHGYPSSRIEAAPIDAYARDNNIRILSLDRPGFGLSTPVRNRQLVDWPSDVMAFARGMGLRQFAIMGLSGGGPFAVACANAVPSRMLTGVGLFATGPPWAAGRHYMTRPRRIFSTMSVYWPGGLKIVMTVLLSATTWIAKTGFVTKRIDAWLESLQVQKAKEEEEQRRERGEVASPVEETESKPILQQRQELLSVLIGEPFVQGTDAMVQEARILSSADWGFKLEDVKYGPIQIWHGSKDVNAPIEAIRYLADKLPQAKLTEFKEDTHYTMGKHINQAVEELMEEKTRGGM